MTVLNDPVIMHRQRNSLSHQSMPDISTWYQYYRVFRVGEYWLDLLGFYDGTIGNDITMVSAIVMSQSDDITKQ